LSIMKILYVSLNYTSHDYRFLKKMVESGNEIFFVTLNNKESYRETRPVPNEVKTVQDLNFIPDLMNFEKIISLMPFFEEIIKKISPDIIHAGPVQSCGFLTALADFHPFVLMSWGSDILVDGDRNDLSKWITRFTIKKSGRIVCDCDAVRKKIHEIADYSDDKIVQFPWGIDLQMFSRGHDTLHYKSTHNWENCFILLSTRMWEPIYGINFVLRSFHAAYGKNPKLRLILLGKGSQEPEIRKFIDQNNLHKVIVLPGSISNDLLPDYYRAADAYISCALSDGTSVSLLEAFASGLPVIVTDAPGNQEWVIHGKNGWLIKAGDVRGFTDAILTVSNKSQGDLDAIAKRNRNISEQKANWDKNSKKLLTMYHQIGEKDD